MSSTRNIVLAAVAAGVLGVGASLWMHGVPKRAMPAAPVAKVAVAGVGAPLPSDLALDDLAGTSVNLHHRFAGRPLLINFWASWCGPCIEEMPELQRFATAQGEAGVQVLGIALDEADNVRDFLQKIPVSYPILLDSPGPADSSVRLGNAKGVLPYSLLIGADGRISKQKLGPFEAGEIDGWVR